MKKVYLCLAVALILVLCSACGKTLKDDMDIPIDTDKESESVTSERLNQNIQISSEDADQDFSNAAEFNSVAEDNTENSQETEGMEEQMHPVQGSEEVQNLRQRMEDFCQAYFHGDAEAVKDFLSASYSGDIDVYENPEEVENMDMRDITGLTGISGLSDTENYTLSKPFIVQGDDSLTYLSVTFVIENGEWKVSFYGLDK